MKFLALAFLSLSVSFAHAQMSETEVSEMCMNQILAGLASDKTLGPDSGLCVKLNKDESGNISGMDFNMQSSAFELGKDNLQDEEAKKRLATIKQLVLDYQRTVTKNQNLQIDDIDIQVKSFADGVGGPTGYDGDIKKSKTWGDLSKVIGADLKSLEYLHQIAPKSKNASSPVNFDSLDPKAQSIIRNIVLGKKRSEEICRQFGLKNCNKKENAGFASPELEKAPKDKRNCPDRRVSVIKVNLSKAGEISPQSHGEFHPAFQIPADAEYKKDMQVAASFEIFKHHKEVIQKYSDPAFRESYRQELLKLPRTDRNVKLLEAVNGWDPNKLSILDLPEPALNSGDYPQYATMMKAFEFRYNKIRNSLSNSPEMLKMIDSGEFIKFKEYGSQVPAAQRALYQSVSNTLTAYGNGDEDTDLLNYFSAGQAMQYSFIKQSGSPYLTRADQFMNQSNGTLDIKFSNVDFHGGNKQKNSAPVILGCHGGCGTGVKEDLATGEFTTDFRNASLKDKKSSEMASAFPGATTFGSLKSLSVYTIKDCANCECLKNPSVTMDAILGDSNRTVKTSVNKMTKQTNGSREFTQSAGVIADPHTTCIFTPPIAHTCKVKPEAGGGGHTGFQAQPNYACPFYDKTTHGLKWTADFVKDGLGLATNSTQQVCDVKKASLKDQATSALCEQSEPDDVPVACK